MIWLEFSPSPWWRHGRKWNMEPEAQNPIESVRSAADWTGLETDTRFSADRLRGSGHTFRLGVSTSVFTNCSCNEVALKPVWSSRKVKSNFAHSVTQEWFYCRDISRLMSSFMESSNNYLRFLLDANCAMRWAQKKSFEIRFVWVCEILGWLQLSLGGGARSPLWLETKTM